MYVCMNSQTQCCTAYEKRLSSLHAMSGPIAATRLFALLSCAGSLQHTLTFQQSIVVWHFFTIWCTARPARLKCRLLAACLCVVDHQYHQQPCQPFQPCQVFQARQQCTPLCHNWLTKLTNTHTILTRICILIVRIILTLPTIPTIPTKPTKPNILALPNTPLMHRQNHALHLNCRFEKLFIPMSDTTTTTTTTTTNTTTTTTTTNTKPNSESNQTSLTSQTSQINCWSALRACTSLYCRMVLFVQFVELCAF